MRHFYKKVLADTGTVGVPDSIRGEVVAEAEKIRTGIELCRAITKKYGTSFYFATQFFPKDVREGIYAIYAFARIPDEIVDDPEKSGVESAREGLKEWRATWREASARGDSSDPILAAILYIFSKYEIPVSECEAFLDSMFMDLDKVRYRNYDELETYMYGSAAVIGLMVTRVVGYHSDDAFPYAEQLGYAFQLTNFLRDIQEDSQGLKRIYMPQDELRRFGISEEEIILGVCDDKFKRFMRFQIERNRDVYRKALPGISLLKWRGRLAVKVSYVLYKEILAEIEKAGYNVFKGRVRTNFRQKVALSVKALFGIYE